MRLDRRHIPWATFAAVLVALAATWYAWELAAGDRIAWSGGSAAGITIGVAGYVCMLLAGFLTPRKMLRVWRLGRVIMWMRLHIWLGLAALPLIWLHGGFRHGGVMTALLMWLLYAVVASGVVGLILQHIIPRRLLDDLERETVYDQIDVVHDHLLDEADEAVAAVGPAEREDRSQWRTRLLAAARLRKREHLIDKTRLAAVVGAIEQAPVEGSAPLHDAYYESVRPHLAGGRTVDAFATRRGIEQWLANIEHPQTLHPAVEELAMILGEHRDLQRQRWMHRLLHVWLAIHVPLSAALLLLGAVHAVMALRYVW